MQAYKSAIYLAVGWILTILIAYGVGWWQGMERATRVASNVASSSGPLIIGALIIVAILSATAAFRVRGYFNRKSTLPDPQA